MKPEGDLGAGRSGVNRRGREKRRGRNEAAEVRPRMVDAPTLMRWRGEQPYERSSVVVGSLAGLAADGPGGKLGALRER